MNWKKWIGSDKPNARIVFRASFALERESELTLHWFSGSVCRLYLDGSELDEGPYRFEKGIPEAASVTARIGAGRHALCAVVQHIDEDTRILKRSPAYFACKEEWSGASAELIWKTAELRAYAPGIRRINPQLGYIEFCDLRQLPEGFLHADFDDSGWDLAREQPWDLGDVQPVSIQKIETFIREPRLIGKGTWSETFGYELDDLPTRFSLRALDGSRYPSQGVYYRFDLGKVSLSRFEIEGDFPEGTEVEIAYAESLTEGRVLPYINFSAGTSCNLDHYLTRAGKQRICPLEPRGGRFAEVHIRCDEGALGSLRFRALERGYFAPTQASFECSAGSFRRIWEIGVETLRSCCEDAVIDNPTRERGEWTGDVMDVALQIMSVAYPDVRLVRNGLLHSAYCADEEGMIAGLVPGGVAYLSTYALQWVNACYHYFTVTGDRQLMETLFPYALRNIRYFSKRLSEAGISRDIAWAFVDWGYRSNEGESNMAVNLHFLSAVRTLLRWAELLDKREYASELRAAEEKVCGAIRRYLKQCSYDFGQIGLHRSALALAEGFFDGATEKTCVEYLKKFYRSCFPNDRTAPMLWSPAETSDRLITPYFSHYVFPLLIERGEAEFVLEQFETCWGWLMQEDRTTWLEVFDPRWSHCHQWSGCPTWLLSRYGLGVFNRFDLGAKTYELRLFPGDLQWARGRIPITGTEDWLEVEWARSGEKIVYTLRPAAEITVLHSGEAIRIAAGTARQFEWTGQRN